MWLSLLSPPVGYLREHSIVLHLFTTQQKSAGTNITMVLDINCHATKNMTEQEMRYQGFNYMLL